MDYLRGQMLKLVQMILKKVRKNCTPEEAAEMLEEDLTIVQRIYEIAKNMCQIMMKKKYVRN